MDRYQGEEWEGGKENLGGGEVQYRREVPAFITLLSYQSAPFSLSSERSLK